MPNDTRKTYQISARPPAPTPTARADVDRIIENAVQRGQIAELRDMLTEAKAEIARLKEIAKNKQGCIDYWKDKWTEGVRAFAAMKTERDHLQWAAEEHFAALDKVEDVDAAEKG